MERLRLLLVEDDLTDQLSFKRFIKQEKLTYDYQIAGSVTEATSVLASQNFDIIIADHSLGDGTAFDLFEYIPKSSPIIFVTGNGNEHTAVKALKAGASDYLTKDLNGNYLNLLPHIIENVLKSKTAELELENYRQNLEAMVEERTKALQNEIIKRREVERQLRLLAITFETHEAIVITDDKATILRVNSAFTELTGYTAREVLGHKMSILKSGRQDILFYKELWNTLLTTGQYEGEVWNRKKSGEVFPEWLTITAIRDEHEVVTNYVGVLADITQQKNAENEIKKLAFYDPLTELANRRLLLDRITQELAVARRNKFYGSVIFIDLDGFKPLNDTYGHHIGDELLVQVANRLSAILREDDTASRLGGDEFIVLIHANENEYQPALDKAMAVAIKIKAALNEVYILNDTEHSFSASLGITVFPGQIKSAEEVLKQADKAMYASKNAGRNTISIYQAGEK